MIAHTEHNDIRITFSNGSTMDVCRGCLDRYEAVYGVPISASYQPILASPLPAAQAVRG